jgi:hypothetical protein
LVLCPPPQRKITAEIALVICLPLCPQRIPEIVLKVIEVLRIRKFTGTILAIEAAHHYGCYHCAVESCVDPTRKEVDLNNMMGERKIDHNRQPVVMLCRCIVRTPVTNASESLDTVQVGMNLEIEYDHGCVETEAKGS